MRGTPLSGPSPARRARPTGLRRFKLAYGVLCPFLIRSIRHVLSRGGGEVCLRVAGIATEKD